MQRKKWNGCRRLRFWVCFNYRHSSIYAVMWGHTKKGRSKYCVNRGYLVVVALPLCGDLESCDIPHLFRWSLFQKCNFWNSLDPFWGRQGCWGQTTPKLKTMKILNENTLKIDWIQNLASMTSKMASWPRGPQKGLSEFFQKIHF